MDRPFGSGGSSCVHSLVAPRSAESSVFGSLADTAPTLSGPQPFSSRLRGLPCAHVRLPLPYPSCRLNKTELDDQGLETIIGAFGTDHNPAPTHLE